MAENKPTNRERLREITDGIEQGIKELFESEKYMRYLSVMYRFHRYSVNNTMLIYMQKPDATLVAHILFTLKQFLDPLLDAICDFPCRSRLVGLFSAMIFNLLSKCVISAEKMGGRQFSPDTGGRTAPPFCGSNPEENLCRVPVGPFSL